MKLDKERPRPCLLNECKLTITAPHKKMKFQSSQYIHINVFMCVARKFRGWEGMWCPCSVDKFSYKVTWLLYLVKLGGSLAWDCNGGVRKEEQFMYVSKIWNHFVAKTTKESDGWLQDSCDEDMDGPVNNREWISNFIKSYTFEFLNK